MVCIIKKTYKEFLKVIFKYMFKIKIDCTNYIEPKNPLKPHNNQLYYKNQIINTETKFDFDFNSIDIIDKCYD